MAATRVSDLGAKPALGRVPSAATLRLRRLLGADWRMGFLFILPIVVLVLALVAYPFSYAIYLSMTLGMSWNDTEIDDSSLVTATCGSGQCTVLDPLDVNGFAILDGNPFPQAPEYMANIVLRYITPVDGGDLFFQTDWAFQGDAQFFLYESAEFHSGDIYEGGVRAGFTADDDRWEISVFGRNVTDEENLKGGIDFNNNTGFVNDRRIWGASLKINFGTF